MINVKILIAISTVVLLILYLSTEVDAEKTSVKLETHLFASPNIEHNFKGISSTTAIRGTLLNSSDIKGIQNNEIHFLVNNIEVGSVNTTKDGCFYFNNWNNEKLGSIFNHPINPLMPITIETRFDGNKDFAKSNKYDYDSVLFAPAMGTPVTPKLVVTKNDTIGSNYQIKNGTSLTINMNVDWTYGPAKLINSTLSFNSLPCDISGSIIYDSKQSTASSPSYDVRIFVEDDATPGEYTIGLSGNGIALDAKSRKPIGNYYIDQPIVLNVIH